MSRFQAGGGEGPRAHPLSQTGADRAAYRGQGHADVGFVVPDVDVVDQAQVHDVHAQFRVHDRAKSVEHISLSSHVLPPVWSFCASGASIPHLTSSYTRKTSY